MIDEASPGAESPPPPEAGWYPDPVRRAAYRYWNGTEWTRNTRGPVPSGVTARGGPGAPAPMPAHGQVSFGESTRLPSTSLSVSLVDRAAESGHSAGSHSVGSHSSGSVAVAPEPGRGARWPVLLAVVLVVVAFAAGLAVGRMASADDGVTSSPSPPRTSTPATTTAAVTSPSATVTATGSGEIDRLGTALADAERERDEAVSALATSQTQAATAGGQVANLETHVELLRSWFTAEVLDRAQAAFDREVDRACRAADEPTQDNTTHARNMEPAGTHVDLVTAAQACRADG